MLYVALLMLLFLGYIFTYEPRVFASFKTMLFLLASTTLFFALEVIMSWIFASDTGFYLVPIPIIPILILVFFNGRLALAAALYLILLCAPLTTFPIEFIFLQTVASGAAVLSLRDLTQRSQLLKTSAIVTIALWLSYFSLNIMTNGSFNDFSWRMAGAITIAGVLTAMAYILMSLVERVFGFISNVTLVELADTNTPLLRQLSDECPGTFQHSIAVSNLAGDAARLIGANVLLTRAGALYHDIGKLTNPVFYTENQHGVNPHDGLSPRSKVPKSSYPTSPKASNVPTKPASPPSSKTSSHSTTVPAKQNTSTLHTANSTPTKKLTRPPSPIPAPTQARAKHPYS